MSKSASEREAAIARLRKLLAMTVANGCTEAEAIAAAERAARIMTEFDLDDGDVQFASRRWKVKAGWHSSRSRLWVQIAVSTNCAPLMISDGTVEFVGRDPWPEVSQYLQQLTDRAIDRELGAFKRTAWYKRRRTIRAKRAAARDFTESMVQRLAIKIDELFAATASREAYDRAVAERDARHPSSQTVARRASADTRYHDAAWAGWAAGESTEISHGVAGGAPPLAIGAS